MLRVYIADLANELLEIDNKSIPIGIGFVAAYCKKRFGDEVDVRVFRTFKPLQEQLKEAPPDVMGFGSYDWNFNLSLSAASLVKKANPKCLVVLGGANAEIEPSDNKVLLENNPQIDMVVYGDGEYPFANIVESILKHRNEADPIAAVKLVAIDGVRALVDGKIVMGQPADIVDELDTIPSPYLTGLFDSLLENQALMPILQNVRGCPYKCRFCVSGTQSSKIRHFSFERITAEIEYLRVNAKNRFLRLSDDNFGVIEHDRAIANYILSSFERDEYPIGLKAYSAKKQTTRTREVALLLRPLMIMCISLQSTTRTVQKETLRVSATLHEAAISLDYARRNKIATGTELIFGLPGETFESWKTVINTTMSLRFDSITMNPLWLLRGADLYRPEIRNTYGYKSKFMLAENAITFENDLLSFECDEIVVSSKHYTYEEWKKFLGYQFLILMCNAFGYGRELVYQAITLGIDTTDLFDELLDNPQRYPVVAEAVDTYVTTYVSAMFDTKEQLRDFIHSQMDKWLNDREALVGISKSRMLYQYIARYLFDDAGNSFLVSIHDAILNLYKGIDIEIARSSTACILDLSLKLIINPRHEFVHSVIFETKYDIASWMEDGYARPLYTYTLPAEKPFTLESRNPKTVLAAIALDRKNNRTDCYSFFRNMNTSLMRRYVVNAGEKALADTPFTPSEPWRRELRVGEGL